ncbi:hypothetical protein [Paucimonas lemoignei]|uniref:hypothetical protein n=1 Tax=Paucimonas lemoignei TaxID=29443 RepID=UPI001050202A|nr:hypothetical protein [Paucimonas lemoignei]
MALVADALAARRFLSKRKDIDKFKKITTAVGTVATVVPALILALWREFLRRRASKNHAYGVLAFLAMNCSDPKPRFRI